MAPRCSTRTLLGKLSAICKKMGLDEEEVADAVHPKMLQFVTRDVCRIGATRADLEAWMIVVCTNAARTVLGARLRRTARDRLAVHVLGIDMETATIFTVGFVNHIPKGALLLVSDSPMTPEGVKTSESDAAVTEKYVRTHLEIGIDALIELRDSGESVEHLRFE